MQLENKQLCQAVQGGLAFHHGNLSAQDRAIIEALFLNRAIAVRFETPDLTVIILMLGVLLPGNLLLCCHPEVCSHTSSHLRCK